MTNNAMKLDTNQLDVMLNGVSEAQVNPIVEELFRDFANRRQALTRAIEDLDFSACRLQAHSLKALSQTFGLVELYQLTRKLEEASRNDDIAAIRELAADAFGMMESCREALSVYLQEKQDRKPAGR